MLVDKGTSTAPSPTAEPPQIGALNIQGSNTTRNFEYIGLSTKPNPLFTHHPYGHNGDE
ncbi:MAG TPA: hypothetical protein PK002_10805 [Cellvibrio sp.]|nr:hypothetical protein [Cellvibrio sp.]